MNRLREIEAYVIKEHTNLVKSKGRPRSEENIREKRSNLHALQRQYQDILVKNQASFSDREWLCETDRLENILTKFNNCQKILKFTPFTKKGTSLKAVANTIILCKRLSQNFGEMPEATETFDLKTATALIQNYDGSADGLASFLDATSLLDELTPANQQGKAVKFLKTRLTGKARLGLPENLNTINQVAQDVKNRCASRETPDAVIAKLRATKQKGNPEKFCEEIDDLTAKLKAVYLRENMPEALANSMSTKAGVDALTNGINSQELKIILKAGSFHNIKDAIQKVNENASTSQNPAQVLTFNTRNDNNHRYQRGGRGNFQWRNNQRHGQRGHHSYRQFNQPRYANASNNNNNNNNNRGRRGAQHGQGNRYSQGYQRNIYMAQVEPQVEQPRAIPVVDYHQQQMMMPPPRNNNASQNNASFLGQVGLNGPFMQNRFAQ